MANQLKMALVESIITLHGHGWSARRITRELGIHRETVGRYVNCASPAKPASNAPTDSPSVAEPWRDVINQKLESGLTAQRIYQDLVSDHGYGGSYYSVRRLADRIRRDRIGGEAVQQAGERNRAVLEHRRRRGNPATAN